MRELTIIGAGNVGTTLGVSFARHGCVIQNILSRTTKSAERAFKIIGQGKVVESLDLLSPIDICMVTTNDNTLAQIGEELAQSGLIVPGTIVFHCSGATPSSIFDGVRRCGASIASIHPLKTFTSPEKDAETFPGTWCGIEGDTEALEILEPLFKELGANTFTIDGDKKILYHTAIVFMCNYLFPLIEAGFRCYEEAGVPRSISAKLVDSILHATVENALNLGPAKALTGPIARGDDVIVQKQLKALAEFDPDYEALYRMLGKLTLTLSEQKGVASSENLQAIRQLLE